MSPTLLKETVCESLRLNRGLSDDMQEQSQDIIITPRCIRSCKSVFFIKHSLFMWSVCKTQYYILYYYRDFINNEKRVDLFYNVISLSSIFLNIIIHL